jgi:hypothetical protein
MVILYHAMQKLMGRLIVGQPSSTGLIATQIEQPFFASFQSNTSLPIEVAFKSLDKIAYPK